MIALLALTAGLFAAVQAGWLPAPGPALLSLRPAATPAPEALAPAEETLVLPAGCWYALALPDAATADQARQAADAYRLRGAAGYIPPDGEKQVLFAAYPSRADARLVQRQLLENHGLETVQTDIVWPEIRLKTAGQQLQVSALQDACAALHQLPEQLFSLASALDRGEAETGKAQSALLSARDTLAGMADRLRAAFGRDAPPAVTRLRDGLDALAAALGTAGETSGAVRLGGQVKYCHFSALALCRALSESLRP